MSSRIADHLRRNVYGLIAIFIALGGTAYAANTVGTADIIDNAVRSVDLRDNSVRGADIANDTLTALDLGNNIIGSEEVVDNELEGVDISEPTLGQVPSALVGGFGRGGGEGLCDPESETFLTCAFVDLTVPAGGARALVIARVAGFAEGGASTGEGFCRLGTSTVGVVPQSTVFVDADRADVFPTPAYVTVMGITPTLPVGGNSFGIDCNQSQVEGAVEYREAAVTAVLISPS